MLKTLTPKKLVNKTKAWLKTYLIQDIPANLSPCEFDCHQSECTYEKAEGCRKREVLVRSQGNQTD